LTVSRATRERLAAVAREHGLTDTQCAQLLCVVAELEADDHAPSAVRAADRVVEVHVADSLSALELPRLRAARHVVDIGSGAGFPGVPIAVALPGSRVSLVESQARRCVFLRRVCRAASVSNAEVVCARVEQWTPGQGACDVALARALAPLAVVLEYAAPLLRLGGALVDWRAEVDREARAAAERAADELGLEAAEVRKTRPFEGAEQLWLHLYLKVRATPERFPRRPGMARKRPLGLA
jgi:16S rRNA (guanine527-N7)-methyltransferase